MSQQQNNDMQKHFCRASAADFGKIPGSPVAYWLDSTIYDLFEKSPNICDVSDPRQGMATTDNATFLRYWHELSFTSIGFGFGSAIEGNSLGYAWFPYNKGGDVRRWYGNNSYVVKYDDNGERLIELVRGKYPKISDPEFVIKNRKYYFQESVTWTDLTSLMLSARLQPKGAIFDVSGHSTFVSNVYDRNAILALLNSKLGYELSKVINSSFHFQVGDYKKLPFPDGLRSDVIHDAVQQLIAIFKADWDAYEFSYDFSKAQLVLIDGYELRQSYEKWRSKADAIVKCSYQLEMEINNEIRNALSISLPIVTKNEITLTCNPHYRYGGNLTDEEREARLQSDTLAELISYAIGCMMGRYSLDREGLVYAHAGNEGFKALVEEGAYASFAADDDGILPLSTDSWFEDDVATRLEAFVCTVWGKETLEENLQFIADSLCLAAIKPVKKGGETARETLRRYLSTQFYKDHLKTYKKRPIYWLFSSGKEKAFECLVYLHRYNEATLPRMRTEYVTPLLGQMAGRIERLRLQQTEASTSDAKRIGKEIDSLTKQLSELRAFDDQLKHHADMRITLDLDDGVKVNYGKFGTLLSDVKAITGDKGE